MRSTSANTPICARHQQQPARLNDDLAAKICAEHRACIAAETEAQRHAVLVGQLLIFRAEMDRDGWRPWLQPTPTSANAARRLMRIAPRHHARNTKQVVR